MDNLEELYRSINIMDDNISRPSFPPNAEELKVEDGAEGPNDVKEQQMEDIIKAFTPERLSNPESEFIFLPNKSSDAFKSLGIRDNYTRDSGKPTEFSPKGPIHPQVAFSFIDVVEVESSPPKNFPLQWSASQESSPPVYRYSYIRERLSSSKAEIVTVSQNVITITENSMAISPSKEVEEEQWEVEEGFMISTLLKRVPYSPQAFMDPVESSQFSEKLIQPRSNAELKCSDFLSPVATADLFITNMIHQAKAEHRKLIARYGDPARQRVISGNVPYKLKPSSWPSINQFNAEDGLMYIENYIVDKSRFLENWRYTITYRGAQSDPVSDHHYYQVEFGLPNKLYPIPQATASVHFSMEVSRVVPPECPVKVLLKLETALHRSDPEKFTLNDYTLLQILNMKLNYFKDMTF